MIALPYITVRTRNEGGFAGLIELNNITGIVITSELGNAGTEVLFGCFLKPPSTNYKSVKWIARILKFQRPLLGFSEVYLIGLENVAGFNRGVALVFNMDKKGNPKATFKSHSESVTISLNPFVFHEYEIRWYPNKFELYIDKHLVATLNTIIKCPLLPFAETCSHISLILSPFSHLITTYKPVRAHLMLFVGPLPEIIEHIINQEGLFNKIV